MSGEPEVLCRVEGRVGRITLNRPQALHALTTAMCRRITEALLAWRREAGVELVMFDHSGERGFCAGGDIRMLAESGARDGLKAREFFFTEYRMNHLLFHYPKPTLAVMDGVTMGGGVGIAMPCRYRVATERTTYAMPETGIGLFPDVGGGWFLSRMPDHLGLWLALTGARVKAADCELLGVATDFVESDRIAELKTALANDPQAVAKLLRAFRGVPGASSLEARRQQVRLLFSGDSVEAIIEALRAAGSAWAREQLTVLESRSPQAMKIAFRQLRMGLAAESFAEVLAMEYRIASRVVQRHDFIEGVRALIVEKDGAPGWDPPTLRRVEEDLLDEIFAPLPHQSEWSPHEQDRTLPFHIERMI